MCAVIVLVLQGDSEKICREGFRAGEEHIRTFPLLRKKISVLCLERTVTRARHQLLVAVPVFGIKN